ncbi:MAG TPA: AMP-binding protein [Tenuifilaceae bacterium]|jgi:long-chain acyl-CoA synthetase|nr:AMP-binding protein [Bacteroidota bacterium]NLH57326.1 long-chain fatty acid--CoA ligase [Rikenellaceae bacterium]OQC64381.1 MAG: Long-chain-fatty-acid--CoA ligase FadD15 [Bacteroidetes bacterium ADurb.Bin008]HNV81619.1 AMP-binding protein [Tenuifilaceae bacterium]HOF91200.1 AMP-binding protein [Tenuifilaceae bacterium]
MLTETVSQYFEGSIRNNWDFKALSDYKGETLAYSDVAHIIHRVHSFFQAAGIKPGDKVALLGKNSARWCTVYLATVSYGAVIVPILPDFKPADVQGIVTHSDSILLFAEQSLFDALDFEQMPILMGALRINGFSILAQRSDQFVGAVNESKLDKPFDVNPLKADEFRLPQIENDKLAVISYTSGTTGFAKGVMIPHNSLAANIRYAQRNMPLNPGDPIVSFLPLAHTFGCAFEFLFPFTLGCHITILTKTPSPQVILQAFHDVKPALILSVPLVVEKIFKKQVLPIISKPIMKVILNIPGINRIILNKIHTKLFNAFGGNFKELVLGGAAFNPEAEHFFKKIKFPFTVGYGMTECGPLISYHNWRENPIGSSGRIVDTLEIKVDSPDPAKVAGEIIVRGENVMYGYYKNKEATDEVLDSDGWLHTGDLGLMDKLGNIYLKGRIKSLLLGASGKNIYPEEIESIYNNKFGVAETVVVQRNEKLVALIYPDMDFVKNENLSNDDLKKLFDEYKKEINEQIPAYMNVSQVEIHQEEFAKTPKRSIKRFLYK